MEFIVTERLLEHRIRRQISQNQQQFSFKGPLKVVRLCVLGILLPCLLFVIILFIRYRVYTEQMYPLAVSDMRMLDNRVSSTWCQRQLIQVNATFNAFLLPETPNLETDTKHLTMVRHLMLEDDTKEYWGFYLLKGSTVTISTCVRWPGASLIVIRGHKHLHDCAYIGDDSSEELDEILEAIKDGSYVYVNTTKDDQPSNIPHLMKRHRQDVEFHHPNHQNPTKNHTLSELLDTDEITDAKQLKKLLDTLNTKKKDEKEKPNVHVHRNSTIGKGETKNFKFQNAANITTNNTASQEVLEDVLTKLKDLGEKGNDVLERINKRFGNGVIRDETINMRARKYSKPIVQYDENIDKARRRKRELILETAIGKSLNEPDDENDLALEEGFNPDEIADDRGTINETTLNDKSNSEFWSSFSSSEEALLNCAGLILNLPLTPHRKCSNDSSPHEIEEAYLANTVTYKVPINGYYFFVYNSENEVQTNYIRIRFNLHKKVYNVSNPVSTCTNSTETCALNLNFWSDEKVVMELPVNENEDLWNKEYVVISQCEPRTAIYIIFVVSIPILIMIFAFQ
ncbi:hypothetical protein MML48_2g00018005 [Holotrichia oblita]|uniref:Uncharacterized protein n=2 Tax=Holotrichia oblita TaxID=644536 RepID=A0ACB9TIP2_HOLOL|nr:hypothetical protein MML48_2g00015301 [Holotrichia oblita]KAI4466678.1 hypothetical protein MML48_2g00018005 [Holotrichia oblita]